MMTMTELDLRGVFYNQHLGFEERKALILDRIGNSEAYSPTDFDLIHIGHDLIVAESDAEFSLAWTDFEDWADKHDLFITYN